MIDWDLVFQKHMDLIEASSDLRRLCTEKLQGEEIEYYYRGHPQQGRVTRISFGGGKVKLLVKNTFSLKEYWIMLTDTTGVKIRLKRGLDEQAKSG